MTKPCIAWEGKEGVSLLCLKEAAQWSSPKGVPGPTWEGAGSCLTLWISVSWEK